MQLKNILTVSMVIVFMTVLSSCTWNSETFTYDDFGLYTTVERINSNHFRIYFHDTRENRNLDYVEIYYSVSTETPPSMDINFNEDNPYALLIKDYSGCVEKVKSSSYDLTVSKLVKRTKEEADSYVYHDDYEPFEHYYKWSDSTIISNNFVTYSFDPAFLEVSVYENGKHFLGTAYNIR